MPAAVATVSERRDFLRWLVASPLLAAPAFGQQHLVEELTAADVAGTLLDTLISKPEDALTVFDLQRVAANNLPPAHYAYVNTAAGDGSTMQANRDAINAVRLRLRRLVGIEKADTTVDLFGDSYSSPLFLCPVASLGSQHPLGERAAAMAAKKHNTAMAMSTFASNPIETLNEDRGQPVWFQLYTMSTWKGTEMLIRRAEESGAQVMMITVDTPARVTRELGELFNRADDRDCSGCHELPIRGPQKKPMPAGLSGLDGEVLNGAALDWDAVDRIRKLTSMKVVIKGLETHEDTRLAREHGVDAVYVSNHGGRGIHASRGTLECLPEVVDAARELPVLIDSGFRRGADVFKALAMGATAVGIGRPYVWGLGAFGAAGVDRAIELLNSELHASMVQAGAKTVKDIRRSMIAT